MPHREQQNVSYLRHHEAGPIRNVILRHIELLHALVMFQTFHNALSAGVPNVIRSQVQIREGGVRGEESRQHYGSFFSDFVPGQVQHIHVAVGRSEEVADICNFTRKKVAWKLVCGQRIRIRRVGSIVFFQ